MKNKSPDWIGGTGLLYVFINMGPSIMDKTLLHKFLRKETDLEENEQVFQWLRESPQNRERFSVLKAQYVSNTLGRVQGSEPGEAYRRFRKRQTKNKLRSYTNFAVASVLVISFGLYFYFGHLEKSRDSLIQNNLELMVVRNEGKDQKEVLLPDGSTVQLNIDSQIEFPRVFKKDKRLVSIIGEGLFDIVYDSLRPFEVKTQDFSVKVLGTIFNVKSYLNDTQTETTLISGSVEVLREKETPIVLYPSQKAVFHKEEKKIGIEKVVSEDVVAWQKGSLIFKSTPMEQVVLDLERKYDIKIKINSPKLLKYEYTGTFNNLSVKEALQLLVMSSPIQYRKESQEIILDLKE